MNITFDKKVSAVKAVYGDILITEGDINKKFLLVDNANTVGEIMLIDLERNEYYDSWDENDFSFVIGAAINHEHVIKEIISSSRINLVIN